MELMPYSRVDEIQKKKEKILFDIILKEIIRKKEGKR